MGPLQSWYHLGCVAIMDAMLLLGSEPSMRKVSRYVMTRVFRRVLFNRGLYWIGMCFVRVSLPMIVSVSGI
jgi:hypothetical protein